MSARSLLFFKFFCLLYLVFLVPKVISFYSTDEVVQRRRRLNALLGIEYFVSEQSLRSELKGARYGLICGNKSVDQEGNRSVDVLVKHGVHVEKIFVKDDKACSDTKATFPTKAGRDRKTDIPLYFLRGKIDKFLKRNSESVDAFLLDVQDEGVATPETEAFLRSLLKHVAKAGKKLVVLDRPVLLGGVVEGPGEIPWRYGLTIGELVRYFNRYRSKKAAHVTVIPLKRWRRGSRIGERIRVEELPCLFEPFHHVSPLFASYNERRAFYMMLLSKRERLSQWEMRYLKRLCWHLGLHCLDYSNHQLEGVRLSLKNDMSNFSAFNTLLTITRFLKHRKQIMLSFNNKFDESIGSPQVKDFLAGKISFDTLKEMVDKSLTSFYDKAKHCCLYKPLPRVISPEIVKV